MISKFPEEMQENFRNLRTSQQGRGEGGDGQECRCKMQRITAVQKQNQKKKKGICLAFYVASVLMRKKMVEENVGIVSAVLRCIVSSQMVCGGSIRASAKHISRYCTKVLCSMQIIRLLAATDGRFSQAADV
jgi:hypothetical protein